MFLFHKIIPRAGSNHTTGRIWPAGRMFDTPGLVYYWTARCDNPLFLRFFLVWLKLLLFMLVTVVIRNTTSNFPVFFYSGALQFTMWIRQKLVASVVEVHVRKISLGFALETCNHYLDGLTPIEPFRHPYYLILWSSIKMHIIVYTKHFDKCLSFSTYGTVEYYSIDTN